MCRWLTTVLQVLSQALYPVCFFTAWEGNEVALVEEISKLHFTWAPMSCVLWDLWRVLTQKTWMLVCCSCGSPTWCEWAIEWLLS
jgi:hypothetical protein